MIELTKQQYKIAKDVLKNAILRRHEAWQEKMAKLLAQPYAEGENAFDRSMEITKRSKEWFKETMRMEDWYRRSCISLILFGMYEDDELLEAEIHQLKEASILMIK